MSKKQQYTLLGICIGVLLIYLFPLYWMYISALKDNTEIFQVPPTLFPQDPQFNVVRVWLEKNMSRYMWNSFVIALGDTCITVTLGTGCAYVLSKYRNRYIDFILFTILMLQSLPPALLATPMYIMFNAWDILDTRFAVVLASTTKTLPFFVILCRASFLAVPSELEEAAYIDGCSKAGAYFKVALPLVFNAILVLAILNFLRVFGEYVYSKTMITSQVLLPASVGLTSYVGPESSDWVSIMNFASIYVTPLLVMFVFFQTRLVEGMVGGAVKG